MAAKNLAVVNNGEIIIYNDPLDNSNAITRIPLGSRRSTDSYTAALNGAGWSTTTRWGWQETVSGALPAVPVERI